MAYRIRTVIKVCSLSTLTKNIFESNILLNSRPKITFELNNNVRIQ